jgi:fatty acid desaturase
MRQADAASAGNRRRVFANPHDVHCVIFHLTCLAAYAIAFWLYKHPAVAGVSGPWSRFAFVFASAFMLGWISGIDVGVNFHNHAHRRIFTSRFLNKWFGRLWTFSGGWPSFFWEYAHVTVHHANLLGAEDWTVPKRNPDGVFENYYLYAFAHWPWRYFVHLWRDFSSGRVPGQKVLVESSIFLALWSIPFWIDPVMALWLWLLPHWIANVIIMGPGMYVQHAGCVPKSADRPVSHSNVYLSRFFNFTMFNIGYHLEHHDYPGIHWSELPKAHQRLKQQLIDGGAHVVPYGYYHATYLLGPVIGGDKRRARFALQHADYVPRNDGTTQDGTTGPPSALESA